MRIENNKSDNALAILLHLSGFLNGMLPLVVPLIIWLSKKEQSHFINEHGKSAINFQLTTLILGLVAGVFVLVTFGLGTIIVVPIAILFGILYVIFIIIAAKKAYEGDYYRYPFTFDFIK